MNAKDRIGSLLIVLMILCAPLSLAGTGQSRRNAAVEYIGSVAVPSDLQGVVPEDVDAQGRLLVLGFPKSLTAEPALLLWNIQEHAFDTRIALTGLRGAVGPFGFVDQTGDVVGLEGRRVILVHLHTHSVEVAAEVPAATSKRSPFSFVRASFLAIDKRHHKFAAFFNNEAAKKPEVFLYNARSSSPFLSWRFPRFVQGAAWSPDGKKLAVLYSGLCNANLNFYNENGKGRLPTLADIAVFDARTGHLDFSFFSGQPEAQIAYSLDGKLLYCIASNDPSRVSLFPHHGRDAIRVFSAADGKLVRTIRVPHTGVRSWFALSPDGKLIAADATTNATWVPHDPPPIAVRFVLLDVGTGKKLFEHEETWGGGDATATVLMFSPDGQTLIADPNANATGEGPVQIYKLLGAPRAGSR